MVNVQDHIDYNKINRIFSQELIKPNLYYCTHPISSLEDNNILNGWFSRFVLKKLLILMSRTDSVIPNDIVLQTYYLLDELFNQDLEDVILFFRMPEITYIYYQLEEKTTYKDIAAGELLIFLNTFLFTYIFSKKKVSRTKKIQIILTAPNSIKIYSTSKVIIFKHPPANILSAELRDGNLIIYDDKVIHLIPAYDGEQSNDSLYTLESTTTVNDIFIAKDDDFFERFFPFNKNDKDAIWKDINEENFLIWKQCLNESINILKNFWQDSWNEFKENIFSLAPLQPEHSFKPQNYSIHSLRGMIFTSFRPPYMIAQSLIHETGHNKLSTILDLYTIVKNSSNEQYFSPFVQRERPIIFIIHGIFSFLRDLDISLRMINKVSEVSNGSIERYIYIIQQRLQEGIDVIKKNAIFNENGKILMGSLEDHFCRIKL